MMKPIVMMMALLVLATVAREMSDYEYLKTENSYGVVSGSEDDDYTKSFKVICRSKGYPVETHKVLTKDGYWLTAFRIPGGKGESREEAKAKNKPVVFLQHGILDSSDTFIMNYEASAPAFMLANQGYDVWLGNTRGNKYSREHQWLDPDDPVDRKIFFDYDFEDMALYDVEANIDYILKATGKRKLGVVAHSQGTSQMMIKMADQNDWWNDRVSIFVCLAGVARLEHCSSKLLVTLAKQKLVIDTLAKIGVYEMFPANYLQNQFFSAVCKAFPFVCDFFIELVSDEDAGVDNQKRIGVFMGHYPAGTSLRSLDHFAQIIRAEQFVRYDYGEKKNMEKYGQKTPPPIELNNIQDAKTIQVAGDLDRLADPIDIKWLRDQLGNNVVHYANYTLGHMSFLLAEDMKYFRDVMDTLKQNPWE